MITPINHIHHLLDHVSPSGCAQHQQHDRPGDRRQVHGPRRAGEDRPAHGRFCLNLLD